MKSTKTKMREHPAVAGAKRAIRRSLSHLTPTQVFLTASLVEMFQDGKESEKGKVWSMSAEHAAGLPEHHWTCDEPSVTKGGAR